MGCVFIRYPLAQDQILHVFFCKAYIFQLHIHFLLKRRWRFRQSKRHYLELIDVGTRNECFTLLARLIDIDFFIARKNVLCWKDTDPHQPIKTFFDSCKTSMIFFCSLIHKPVVHVLSDISVLDLCYFMKKVPHEGGEHNYFCFLHFLTACSTIWLFLGHNISRWWYDQVKIPSHKCSSSRLGLSSSSRRDSRSRWSSHFSWASHAELHRVGWSRRPLWQPKYPQYFFRFSSYVHLQKALSWSPW